MAAAVEPVKTPKYPKLSFGGQSKKMSGVFGSRPKTSTTASISSESTSSSRTTRMSTFSSVLPSKSPTSPNVPKGKQKATSPAVISNILNSMYARPAQSLAPRSPTSSYVQQTPSVSDAASVRRAPSRAAAYLRCMSSRRSQGCRSTDNGCLSYSFRLRGRQSRFFLFSFEPESTASHCPINPGRRSTSGHHADDHEPVQRKSRIRRINAVWKGCGQRRLGLETTACFSAQHSSPLRASVTD